MLKKRYYIFGALLLIFYTVGIIGLNIPQFRYLFLQLTPFNLLLTLGLLAWVVRDRGWKWLVALLLVFLIGFFVEVAGVKTGLLFGEYTYGDPLGQKLFEVPLMIGVNWFLLTYASAGVAGFLTQNTWIRVFLASLLMVALDVIIEPVAIDLDFWQWSAGNIPIQNYIMWFITAVIAQLAIKLTRINIDKIAGSIVFGIQVYFFLVILLLLSYI